MLATLYARSHITTDREEQKQRTYLPTPHLLIPIPYHTRTNTIHHARHNRQRAKRPRQPDIPNHRLRRKTIYQTPQPTPRSTTPIRQTAVRGEPLRCNPYAADEKEAHAPSETHALGQEKVPDGRREGRADEGYGFEEHADEEGGSGAEAPGRVCSYGRDDECLGDGKPADEGVLERCCAGESGGREVVREEDGVGRV